MVSNHVSKLCQKVRTVSSVLADHPTEAPGEVYERLYGHPPEHHSEHHPEHHPEHHSEHHVDHHAHHDAVPGPNNLLRAASPDSLHLAAQCGRWGTTKPSAMFIQAFSDALSALDADPLCGMVSPPLMGSHGTVPLTVIAPLADVIRHCSNLIARAESDVFFITSTWAPSVAQRLIKNALIELSKRSAQHGRRVVVKIMMDRPGPAHAIDSHQILSPSKYPFAPVELPATEEIPHVDLQVVNLHNVVLGTLHAKFCVVDRKIAAVMSNNVEDNDNLEMMTHIEGPIVDSIYDTALITWSKVMTPVPASLFEEQASKVRGNGTQDRLNEPQQPPPQPQNIVENGKVVANLEEHMPEHPQYDNDMAGEMRRMQMCYSAKPGESRLAAANRQLNVAVKDPIKPTGPEITEREEMTPYISTATSSPVPMALVCRAPYGYIDAQNVSVPQNEAWLSLIRSARRDIFIQTPDLNAAPLLESLADALGRGVEVTYYVCFGYNEGGELLPGQGGTNEQAARSLIASLPANGPELERLHIYNYVGKDQDHPIHNIYKSRSCHIKLLIVDGAVGVQGSGNQDTQSWLHSQEINVMVDSPEICDKWRAGVEQNQNTKRYGKVAEDGVWRDEEGTPGEGYAGDPGFMQGMLHAAKWAMSKK